MSDLAGRMEGAVHVLPLRVYYEDTDAAGMVYYANYLRYTERARTDMLRLAGVRQSELKAQEGLSFAVRRCEVDYLAPARLDDAIEVRSRLVQVGGASLEAEQVVRREGSDLVRSVVRVGCVDERGRVQRIPAAIRAVLEGLVQSEG